MSGTDIEEDMAVDNDYMNQACAQSKIHKPAADEDEALIVLSLKWINPDEPQKIKKFSLEKMLQSWFNKCKRKPDCSVENILPDRRVVIKTEPAPAITELQRLSQQTLTGRDGSSVTVTSVSLTLPPPGFDTQTPGDTSLNHPLFLSQTEQVQREKQHSTASAAGEMLSCSVPVGLFWYVNHMYKEELKHIEKVNGVKISAEVKVKFEVDQKDGSPDKALDEFTNLILTRMTEFSSSVIPLKFIDPDQWSDALKTIQKKENKLLVTLTSKGMTACEPEYSQDVIRKLLCGGAHQKKHPSASLEANEREIEDTSLKIKLTSKDRFPDEGLIMEENYWKLMSTFHKKPVVRIKDKFNVELQESDIGQGKVILQHDDEDEALIVLSLKWINPDEPQKMKRPESRLEKMLQSWFNKCKPKPDCSVEKILTDGRVVIKIKPAQAVTELQKLSQQILTGIDGSSVTVTSVSLTVAPPGFDSQMPGHASMNLPPSLPQTVQVQPQKQRKTASAAGEMLSCSVPVGLFWYVNHMYEEELKRIEKVNGVKIRAEVKVKFEVEQKYGRPDKALDEFTNLIQTCMTESSGSVIPLKFIDPDQWRDALKTIQKKENKLLVTLTAKGMTARGPKYSQDVISKTLFGDPVQHTNTNASLHEYQRELTQAHWRPPQSANRKHNTDAPHGGGATAGDSEEEKCPICLDEFKNKKRLKCKHEFCEECLQQAKDASGPTCPVCRVVFGKIIGDQPDGKMSRRKLNSSLPGFPHCNTIVINYEIPSGIQTERHPNPGRHFSGISRSAYLPDNTEGNEVLQLLKRAFDQRLIFTIGTSRTTGMDGQVTWNDIPHKTSTAGGPQSFGYPDPEYLSRVKEELKAKGIE